MRRRVVPLLFLIASFPGAHRGASARDLTFEDRVRAQVAIEKVYWKHRIWPAENRGPKPPLEAAISPTRIRKRVEDYLEKSRALEAIWKRPITAWQLQAEMERMAVHTRSPDVLREIFSALGDDPFLIAETMARQTLADRLIRTYYARDGRLHQTVRRQAEAALAGVASASELKDLGAVYTETTYMVKDQEEAPGESPSNVIALDAVGFQEKRDRLARMLEAARDGGPTIGAGPDRDMLPASIERLPLMTVGPIVEEDGAFLVTAVLREGPDSLTTATAAWAKTPFDAWWANRPPPAGGHMTTAAGDYAPVRITAASPCVPDTWTPTPGPPDPQPGGTVVWTGSEMILWGGRAADSGLNTGGRYNPSTDTWTATTTSGAPSGRYGHTAVWTGSEMIVWGGVVWTTSVPYPEDAVGRFFNDGARYDPSTDSWSPITTTDAPSARTSHTGVWTGAEMIVWGGFAGFIFGTPALASGGRYDPLTDRWLRTTAQAAPAPRQGHTAVWTGREMIVWGGWPQSGLATPLNNGSRYDPSTDRWASIATSGAPSLRNDYSAVWTGTEMIIWGGWICCPNGMQPSFNTGYRYDPSADTWREITVTGAPSTRYRSGWPFFISAYSAVWTGREMIVWDASGASRTGGRYDPLADRWVATTTIGAPSGDLGYRAVWTGSEMIVWGEATNLGGRYDPATDSWVGISTGEVPAARVSHTAVWTGTEMIVWGGRRSSGATFNTGGRYDPIVDTWVAITTSGAPAPRHGHTAVWTGSEMIVWGGTPGSGFLGDGGRYNPSADSWATISTDGAPAAFPRPPAVWTGSEMYFLFHRSNDGPIDAARYDPSTDSWTTSQTSVGFGPPRTLHGVWTGSEYIFWGGLNYSTGERLGEGGRYDPSTDTWAAISTTGAPSARFDHPAVWTGREMIVWGGYDGTRTVTGGRYDPSNDTWIATATRGAPAARYWEVVVWTGAEMIAWGGGGAPDVPPVTGGRFNPMTDSWADTTTTGAPVGRYSPTAVWTGNEMIIWGGEGFGTFGSGARYCSLGCASPATWYRDNDGDGHGTTGSPVVACDRPEGFAASQGDCDDAEATIHPGAIDVCNGRDDNCDGQTDDRTTADTSCADEDACTRDTCSAGTCAHSPATIPQAVCTAELEILHLASAGKTFDLTVDLTDRCTGRRLDPASLTPLYISGIASPTLGQVVLPTPDTGSECTQDGIWETVADRRSLKRGTMGIKFSEPSDGLCATLDGNRRDILRFFATVPDAERAQISFAATYPATAELMRCVAEVTVRDVEGNSHRPR